VANFIFNWATAALAAATLDLSTGNYYAHLVTTVPALGHATVADLVLPTTSSYASTPLTGLSYNSTRWTFDSFSFPKYSFVSAPTGVVICKRNGATPATTDGIVCYSDFNNSIGQVISLQVGIYLVNLQFGTQGAINFSFRYQYSSTTFASTEPIPKGLIYLIGTKNNTQTFVNPLTSATTNTNNGVATPDYTDRGLGTVPIFLSRYAFDFGNIRIKPGVFGLYHRDAVSKTIELSASNNLLAFNIANIDNNSLWTILGSSTNPVAGWNFITNSNNSYWQYFKLRSSDSSVSLTLQEIEFYNSVALSPTANFA
jgi:hypothetical protein